MVIGPQWESRSRWPDPIKSKRRQKKDLRWKSKK
jgi:hypothetical protein